MTCMLGNGLHYLYLYFFKKIIVLLSFSLCSTVYSVYDTGKGHRTDVSSAL